MRKSADEGVSAEHEVNPRVVENLRKLGEVVAATSEEYVTSVGVTFVSVDVEIDTTDDTSGELSDEPSAACTAPAQPRPAAGV